MKKVLASLFVAGCMLFATQSVAVTYTEHTLVCDRCHDMAMPSPHLKTTDIIQLCGECHENPTHGKFGTAYATCTDCHLHHDIQPLVFQDICLTCHDDLVRKGKHKIDAKCFKCHKHSKGFSRIKKND